MVTNHLRAPYGVYFTKYRRILRRPYGARPWQEESYESWSILDTSDGHRTIDRTKVVTQHFLENSFKKLSIKRKQKKIRKIQKYSLSKCLLRHDNVSFCVVPCVSFCTGHFVMVPLNITNLHCLQHSLFEHLFNLY